MVGQCECRDGEAVWAHCTRRAHPVPAHSHWSFVRGLLRQPRGQADLGLGQAGGPSECPPHAPSHGTHAHGHVARTHLARNSISFPLRRPRVPSSMLPSASQTLVVAPFSGSMQLSALSHVRRGQVREGRGVTACGAAGAALRDASTPAAFSGYRGYAPLWWNATVCVRRTHRWLPCIEAGRTHMRCWFVADLPTLHAHAGCRFQR